MAKETRKIDTSIKAEEGLKKSIVQIEERLKRIAEERSELSKDSVQNQEMLNKLRQEELEIAEKQRKTEKEIDKLTDKRMDDNENLQNIADKYLETLKDHQDEIEQMSDDSRGFLGTQDHIGKLMEQVHNTLESNVALHKEQGSLSEKYLGFMDTSVNYASMSESLQENILEGVERANLGEYTSIDLSLQKLGLRKAEKYLLENKASMTDKEIEAAESNLQLMKKSYQSNIDMNGALVEASKSSKAILGTFDSMMKLDLKGAIRSWFKLDEMNDKIKTQLRGSLVGVVKEFRGEGGLAGGFKAAGKELGGLLKMAPKLAIGFGIGGIVAGVGLLAKAVMHADEEVANMGKELGVSHHEAGMLHGETQRMAGEMKIAGINAQELYEGVKIVSESMGGIDIGAQLAAGNKEIEGFVKQAAILSKQFGLSGDEIGKIKDMATLTGKSMGTLVKESVELGKGTMTAKQSLKILSTIPPSVTVAFKGSTKELIAAAQKAKLLGMELGKVQGIGRGMLEIEDSLGLEMEARVLTGKNLNLDAARQYALQGDTFKLQEEILNQAGSLEDFTKMNTLQQESMAKALGMSVEEMTKMLTNAEKLENADISSDYAAKLDAMESAAELEIELQKQKAAGASQEKLDYIQQLANEKRSVSLKEKMSDMLAKIKAKLSPIVEKIMEMAHEFFDGAKGVSQFDKILDSIDINSLVEDVKKILPKLIEGFSQLIKNLPSIIKMVTSFVEKLSGGIGPVTSIMGMINPGIAGFGIMALKIGGPGGVATGLKLAAGGAKGLFDLVKGPLQDGIGKLAGGVTDKLGGAFGKVADKAKTGLSSVMEKMGKSKMPDTPKAGKGDGAMDSIGKMFEKMDPKKMLAGAAALLIVAAALYVAAKAMQQFSTGVTWEGVLMGIVTLGALVLAVVALGALMMSGVGALAIMAGAAALLILSAALFVMGKAMQEFSKAANMALPFFKELFVFLGPIIQGFAGILMAIADGIKILANSLSQAGPIITAIFQGIATVVTAVAPVLIALADVIGNVLVKALEVAAPIITAVFEGMSTVITAVGGVLVAIISTIADSILKLAEIDGAKLYLAAGGIVAIGGAIAALGAGKAAEGFGSFVGAIFGGGDDPMEKLINFAERIQPKKLTETASGLAAMAALGAGKAAEGFGSFVGAIFGGGDGPMEKLINFAERIQPKKLTETASGLAALVATFKTFAGALETMSASLDRLNLDKLDGAIEKLKKAKELNDMSIGSGIASAASSFVGGIASIFSSGEKTTSVDTKAGGATTGAAAGGGKGGDKLDQVIGLLTQILSTTNQPTVIKFGDKTVEEIKGQLNFKKAYNIGIDNTYGRST